MMYHFEVTLGLSPCLATVKDAPSLPNVGLPSAVKLSDAEVKSMFTVLPNAESGGQDELLVGLQLV